MYFLRELIQTRVNTSRLVWFLYSLFMAPGLYLSIYSLEHLFLIDFTFIVLLGFFNLSSNFTHVPESYKHTHNCRSQHINNTSNKTCIHTFLVLQNSISLLTKMAVWLLALRAHAAYYLPWIRQLLWVCT